jgi:hypothetical protein
MRTVDTPMSTLSKADHHAQLRRALVASTIGTLMEWYDFLLYGTVSALIFGKLYFPHSSPIVGVREAFSVFLSALSGDQSARPYLGIGAIGSGARRP